MKTSFSALRVTLAIVLIVHLVGAVMLFQVDFLQSFYVIIYDLVDAYLLKALAAVLLVFALAALLAFRNPAKSGTVILLLILQYFLWFILDVVFVAQGLVPFQVLLPYMIYFVLMCAALIRFYPAKETPESTEELLENFGYLDDGGTEDEKKKQL